jgi:hypothetical protein
MMVTPVDSAIGAHAIRPPPQADRRHLDDRADATGLPLQDLGDRPSSVLERLARECRGVEEKVVVRVDDAEFVRSSRARDADDVTLRHVASDLRWRPARRRAVERQGFRPEG